tara:strand:+ start:240 stop:389 length:150 start_codon:yes stop_codon:yes gene_type:complete
VASTSAFEKSSSSSLEHADDVIAKRIPIKIEIIGFFVFGKKLRHALIKL